MLYQKKSDLPCTYLDSDLCIFDPNNYKYINFNSTGTVIWNLIEKPKTLSEIMNHLIKIYDIELDKGLPEVKSFLNDGVEKGLINIIDRK